MGEADLVAVHDEALDAPILRMRGAWTAVHVAQLSQLLASVPAHVDGKPPLVLDAREITSIDTYGAWLLERFTAQRRALGQNVTITHLPEKYQGLFDAVVRTSPGVATDLPRAITLTDRVEVLGKSIETLGRDVAGLVDMLGQVGVALAQVIRRPSLFRLTSTVHQIDRVAWQAVPIIVLITFLIGCIIAQQGFFHFRKFGADQYVVDMTGILIVREIGVLLVAIMVAGRSGSSYTAELGSMKMREEIDAIRTMGLDPTGVLILPRIIALIIALPALTLLGSLSALYGGGLVAWFYGDMSPDIYLARLREAISFDHFKVGMLKAPFMALVIGIVACREGLAVQGSAESLGLKTTSSVVKSIFLVIVLDGLFAVYFASIGL